MYIIKANVMTEIKSKEINNKYIIFNSTSIIIPPPSIRNRWQPHSALLANVLYQHNSQIVNINQQTILTGKIFDIILHFA